MISLFSFLNIIYLIFPIFLKWVNLFDSLISLKESFDANFKNIMAIISNIEEYDLSKKDECKKYIFYKTKFEKIFFTRKDTDLIGILHEINELRFNMKFCRDKA